MSEQSNAAVERGCECDCDTAGCTKSNAPVTHLVERDGEEIRVCTRCKLPGDSVVELLIDKETPAQPYIDYDAFGAMSLSMDVDSCDC